VHAQWRAIDVNVAAVVIVTADAVAIGPCVTVIAVTAIVTTVVVTAAVVHVINIDATQAQAQAQANAVVSVRAVFGGFEFGGISSSSRRSAHDECLIISTVGVKE
jgi:hypothetical protein